MIEFFEEHRYLCYGYIVWILAHITLLIIGQNDSGFFPFGWTFFDIDDYGFLEFFVYVIALPSIAYIVADLAQREESVKKGLVIFGKVLLLLFLVCVLFIGFRSFIYVIVSIFNKDVAVFLEKEESAWNLLFDVSNTIQIVSLILCFGGTFLYLVYSIRCFFYSEEIEEGFGGMVVICMYGFWGILWYVFNFSELISSIVLCVLIGLGFFLEKIYE